MISTSDAPLIGLVSRREKPQTYLAKLVRRTEKSAAEAREFNESIQPDHQENFYLAGMNAIAKDFWELAKNPKSNPHEVKLHFDMIKEHLELKIKTKKNDIALRHLKLLEARMKALQELARGPALPSAEFAVKLREICSLPSNGHNGTTRLIEDQIAS